MRELQSDLGQSIQSILQDPESFFDREIPLSLLDLSELVIRFCDLQEGQPAVVKLGEDFTNCLIVGDLHGDRASVLKITGYFWDGKVDAILFLGDYVDRGEYSIHTLIYLMSLKIAFPDQITLLLGNHEHREINQSYGFTDDIETIYEDDFDKVLDQFLTVYSYLPLVAITPGNSICMHGGIPEGLGPLTTLQDVKLPIPSGELFSENEMTWLDKMILHITWNDPMEDQDELFFPSSRSNLVRYFNERATGLFLELNKCKRIIRAHQASRGGYQELFGGKLLHIFSSEPYFGRVEKAAIIHEQEGEIIPLTLDFEKYNRE